jgi:mRNA interferase RelE/StbE
MSFNVFYHQDVKDIDLPKINKDVKLRIKKAIEERLMTDPLKYGKPLRKSLKGYWKLRVGDYRVVYKIEESNVIVLAIIHRKEVYNDVKSRL